MPGISSNVGQLVINGMPEKCPFCHNIITPNPLYGYQRTNGSLDVMMSCPNGQCQRGFIGYYSRMGNYFSFDNKMSQGTLEQKRFSEIIWGISTNFITIYGQAFVAEQQNLLEICGVGYRKALEFLIKDYIIGKLPNEKEKVEKKLLGACIADYVADDRVKKVAKRAVWLGNDETHYIRKWEGKNLEDLKKLIDLTVHWIEMESLTESLEADMPE